MGNYSKGKIFKNNRNFKNEKNEKNEKNRRKNISC